MFLIICSDDIETNPGSKNNIKMSFCRWNLNGIAVHNISKVSLLQAMATTHDHNIISWLKTVLASSFNSLDDQLILKDVIY